MLSFKKNLYTVLVGSERINVLDVQKLQSKYISWRVEQIQLQVVLTDLSLKKKPKNFCGAFFFKDGF